MGPRWAFFGAILGHFGATWPGGGPNMAPRGPKTAPRWPQDGPKIALKSPRWPQEAPKRPQNGPKMAPRWLQDDPKTASRRPSQAPQRKPKTLKTNYVMFFQWVLAPEHQKNCGIYLGPPCACLQASPKVPQVGTNLAPRWEPGAPRWPQIPPVGPRRPQMAQPGGGSGADLPYIFSPPPGSC